MLFAPTVGRADTLRVSPGRSSIQEALDAARDGDTVLLAPGTYRGPGNRDLDFRGKAIALRSALGATGTASTVIDCEWEGRAFDFHSGEGPAAVLEHLTIERGRADFGAGIRCRAGSSPTLRGLTVKACEADDSGGGLLCEEEAAPELEGVWLIENAAFLGGGLHCQGASPSLRACRLAGNEAQSGGGLHCREKAAPRLEDSELVQNHAKYGGGMYCDFTSPSLTRCRIAANSSLAGAGVFLVSGASPLLDSCRITGNDAEGNGGGMCCLDKNTPMLVNCLIDGNRAFFGGALAAEEPEDRPSLINCTITGNRAMAASGGLICSHGATPRVINTVVWANEPESVCGRVTTSLAGEDPMFLRQGVYDFGRFIRVQVGEDERPMPAFVVDEGDYRLQESSPCIENGDTEDVELPPLDLAGRSRICGPQVDIGAYEECPPEPVLFLRGDSNGDGAANFGDAFATLDWLFQGGPRYGCAKAHDVNDDGRTDIVDPVELLRFLFLGGPAPAPPYPECGLDPTADDISCEVGACGR